MTSDRLERRLPEVLTELSLPRPPEYLDSLLSRTERMPQRPGWTFLERWLPMDTAMRRPAALPRTPVRILLLVVVAALLAALAGALIAGSRNRAAPPFGPAANGSLVYGLNGDLYVRDTLSAVPRLLLGGPGEQGGVIYSFDGQLIAYDNVNDGVDLVTVANADGSNPRVILKEPFTGGTATWSPDGRYMVLGTGEAGGTAKMWIATTDGSGARELRVPGLEVIDAVYTPADDGTVLIRGFDGRKVDVYLVNLDGTVLRTYGLHGDMLNAPYWEMAGLTFSPDGRTIANNSVEAAGFRTYLMDADGGHRRMVPLPAGVPFHYHQAWPAFSPDGRWIALETWVDNPDGGSTNQLGIAPADGSAPPRLIGPQLRNQAIVKSWAPDSSTLLFAARDEKLVFQADPETGETERLPWNSELPDWQRRAP